jgi:hypothetical protein
VEEKDPSSKNDAPPKFAGEQEELELKIAQIKSKIKAIEARSQYLKRILSLLGILVGAVAIFFAKVNPSQVFGKNPELVSMLGVVYAAAIGSFTAIIRNTQKTQLQSELDEFEAKRRIARGLDSTPSSGKQVQKEKTYFDSLVSINIENLATYYTQVKSHTNKSFLVALGSGIVGFMFIITGVSIGAIVSERSKLISLLSTSSGIIIEFISAIFFYLYNKTVRQMKEYHDSLLKVQNILLSFKIVQDTNNEAEKVKMFSQMIAFLMKERELPKPEEKNAEVSSGK